jgi:hypothetical protein
MTYKQESRLSHYSAIRQLCENNRNVWKDYHPFVRSYDAFLLLLPQIEQNRNQQMTNIIGFTKDRSTLRQELIESIWFISTRLQSFTVVTNNDSLLPAVKLAMSTLTRSSDTGLIEKANIIYLKASENISGLEPYGITQQNVAGLETITRHFTTTISCMKDARSARSTATSSLKRLFTTASGILHDRLDIDAQYFKNIDPDFFTQYISLRRLDKRGRKKKQIKQYIPEAEKGK